MQANEFIKKWGIERARREIILLGTEAVITSDQAWVDELKRLVESHDLVESFGCVEMAKRYLDENLECEDSKTLRQAIADVESCQ